MTEKCTVTERSAPGQPLKVVACESPAAYRVDDFEEDKEGFLCKRHAKILRDMYEPGQLRRIPPRREQAK